MSRWKLKIAVKYINAENVPQTPTPIVTLHPGGHFKHFWHGTFYGGNGEML